MPIDHDREFLPLNIAILTLSDSRGLENDISGQVLVDKLTNAGHILADRAIIKDDKDALRAQLKKWISDDKIEVIISTGGTGLTGRDITPEIFHEFYDKEIEGFGEIFRAISFKIIGTSSLQSRATGGVANGTYMFAVPGSPGACKDAWNHIFAEQLDIRFRPCNFAEMMPRLKEK
ncbi:MAG: molybdenum cofactor biosynthesis protein B [Alphaproteobacteria bacterium]|mgnify:CR=1 FL=1|nr:molybdenum cofactor biosynthesis protein B [Alphaproteobacteria bacterium]HPF46873.1 molybdenum cofactor biosynthesis protein B [Emcibacteraceae bacterium]HRW31144.1 molybdenum cofactor biosynthesis protein B [Emcibacteraceae bacterium]